MYSHMKLHQFQTMTIMDQLFIWWLLIATVQMLLDEFETFTTISALRVDYYCLYLPEALFLHRQKM